MPKVKIALEDSVRMERKTKLPYRTGIPRRCDSGKATTFGADGRQDRGVSACNYIPKDERWFWTSEWQRKEREADEDIAQGRSRNSGLSMS